MDPGSYVEVVQQHRETMAAIDIVQKLRYKHKDASAGNGETLSGTAKPIDFAWGTLKTLGGVDIGTLPRQELRSHLEARDQSTLGNKRQLIERLKKSVLEEQVRDRTQ